jgi:Amt family ammonium transporter
VLAGLIGWLWANPLQVEALSSLGMLRGSVNVLLAGGGGRHDRTAALHLVCDRRSHPTLVARGLVAGAVAGLAAAPLHQPGAALVIGRRWPARPTPLLAYIVDHLLRLDDATGAGGDGPAGDHRAAAGGRRCRWRGGRWLADDRSGSASGRGGSGCVRPLVAQGFQRDFPGQLQAQVIGIVALSLWGFVTGLLVCAPLALLFHGLQRSAAPDARQELLTPPLERPVQPFSE